MKMARRICLVILVWPSVCFGQGTLRITFDDPPQQLPGSAIEVQSYAESGMWFHTTDGYDGFTRTWNPPPAGRPNDGSPYIQATIGDSLSFGLFDDSLFTLTSIDLAGYSTAVPNVTAYFVGYRRDGSTISTSILPTSGINFETYYFASEWSGLTHVDMPDFSSLDNLVVAIPESGTGALFALGALAFATGVMRRKSRKEMG